MGQVLYTTAVASSHNELTRARETAVVHMAVFQACIVTYGSVRERVQGQSDRTIGFEIDDNSRTCDFVLMDVKSGGERARIERWGTPPDTRLAAVPKRISALRTRIKVSGFAVLPFFHPTSC